MKKNLVRCPNCEVNGKKEVLGEIDQNGNFVVMRFHKGTTIVKGDKLNVTCGVCGEVVYRKEVYEPRIGYFRQSWFYRGTLTPTLGTIGA